MNTVSKNQPSIHIGRLLGCIAVICIHASIGGVFAHQTQGVSWWSANLLNAASRFAVPLFIVMSGSLLLNARSIPASSFIKKRTLRLFLPTLAWITIYAFFYSVTRHDPLNLSYILSNILFNQPYEHLYFLFLITQLYFITPLLWNILNRLQLPHQILLLSGAFLLSFLYIPNRFLFSLGIPYISYYLLGYFLSRYQKVMTILIRCAVPLAVISTLGIAIGTSLLISLGVTRNLYLYEYTNPLVVIQTLGMAGLIDRLAQTNWSKRNSHLLSRLSSLTLGVYLIAPLIMQSLLLIATKTTVQPSSIGSIVILALTTTLLSFVIIKTAKSLPILKGIV